MEKCVKLFVDDKGIVTKFIAEIPCQQSQTWYWVIGGVVLIGVIILWDRKVRKGNE